MTVNTMPRVLDPFSDCDALTLAECRGYTCEACGGSVWQNGGPERNHCLVPDRRRYHKQVTVAINFELVCHRCHQTEECHTFVHRVAFKRKQEERYGVKRVDGWLRSIPMVSDGIVEA